jgi:hypothetical protein
MTKIEHTPTTSSRRGLLMGLAAAAAVPAPALATALASAAGADPIFAAIDLHRKAWSEMERTHKIFQKHADEDERFRPMEIIVGEEPVTDWKKITVDGLRQFHEFRTGEMQPIIAHNEKQIAAHAPTHLTEAEQATWVRNKTTEMESRYAAKCAHYEETPRSRAYNAWNDACIVAEAVTKQLVDARPTTIGGVAAVLAYWSEIASEDHFETDLGSTTTFLEALAEAVQAIHAPLSR